MDNYYIVMTIMACVPAIVLLVYVYKKDKYEKEPFWLLAILFLFGMLICYPAAKAEGVMSNLVLDMFSGKYTVVDGVRTFSSHKDYVTYKLTYNMLVPGLVEELFKWLVLLGITRKNKNFNSLFDGLIYAVCVGLGFAMLENILYCINYGTATALKRAVTAVPTHLFLAVFMGYYYSYYHVAKMAHESEKYYVAEGFVVQKGKPFRYKKFMIYSLFVPIVVHGYYDYCAGMSVGAFNKALFTLLLVTLYVVCFGKIKRMSKIDIPDKKVVTAMLIKKYPQLMPVFKGSLKNISQDDYVIN